MPEVEEKLTKEQFTEQLARLESALNSNQAQLMATVSAIARIDERQDDSELERRNDLEKIRLEIEAKVKETEKAIAELKAKYPEYAESAK